MPENLSTISDRQSEALAGLLNYLNSKGLLHTVIHNNQTVVVHIPSFDVSTLFRDREDLDNEDSYPRSAAKQDLAPASTTL